MSEQIFDRLIYTDCRPGEGLGGGGGYQIQAQSTSCGAAQAYGCRLAALLRADPMGE